MTFNKESGNTRSTSQEKNKSNNNKYLLRRAGAGVLIGVTVGTGASIAVSHNTQPSHSTQSIEKKDNADLQQAVEAVAHRYQSCTIVDANDLHRAENGGRTTVHLTLNLKQNPDAQAPLERYEFDDTVTWHPPVFEGLVDVHGYVDSMEEGYQIDEPTKVQLDDETVEYGIDVHPLAKDPEGTSAKFTLGMRAESISHSSNSLIDCDNNLVFKNGEWKLTRDE